MSQFSFVSFNNSSTGHINFLSHCNVFEKQAVMVNDITPQRWNTPIHYYHHSNTHIHIQTHPHTHTHTNHGWNCWVYRYKHQNALAMRPIVNLTMNISCQKVKTEVSPFQFCIMRTLISSTFTVTSLKLFRTEFIAVVVYPDLSNSASKIIATNGTHSLKTAFSLMLYDNTNICIYSRGPSQ